MFPRKENILILAKTYPSPSKKYLETSCVAGITDEGEMRRLYPVPFRRLEKEFQFKKWQWIQVETESNSRDKRAESRKVNFSSIQPGAEIKTSAHWEKRMVWIKRMPEFYEFESTGTQPHLDKEISLALFTPKSGVRLDIVPAAPYWSKEQYDAIHMHDDGNILFKDEAKIPEKELEKIPFDFYYVLIAPTHQGVERMVRLKIVDWEVCALFRNCHNPSNESWKEKLRNKLESEMNNKNLKLLLGNQHRFQHQWMIVSLLYPPKQSLELAHQSTLF